VPEPLDPALPAPERQSSDAPHDGAPLVRLVGPAAIEMLIDEFPNLALNGDPQWQTDPYLRAVTNLTLRVS